MLLSACSSGGGDKSGGTTPPSVTTMTISGLASYEFVPPNASCNGLNFGATMTRPIRAATVELIDASDSSIIATVATSAAGQFTFDNVDRNIDVRLRVRAELKQSSPGWDVEVRDNFVEGGSDYSIPPPVELATRPIYVLDGSVFSTGTVDVTRNLTAMTGWDGSAYADTRAAAPFALLDVTYAMMQFVRTVDPNVNFPPLDMFWSVNNNKLADAVDLTAGDLSTSSYWGGIDSLFILGDDTDDTDEFDDHIVAHEWSHYFEDTLSRSDSVGGPHFLGESLEARIAFSEGWASAMGAMGLNDPIYCDTGVPGTSAGGGYNADSQSFGVKGWFNEVSVTGLIYDLWDTTTENGDNDSLGFGPIYNVMTGPQASTDAFTTLFSFATELRSSLNTQGQALVDTLLERENTVSGNALTIWGENESNDAGVGQTVLPLYSNIVADGSINSICVNNSLDGLNRHGNNVGEDRYLRISVPVTDEYDVVIATTTATPVTADPDDRDQSDPDIYIYKGPQYLSQGLGRSGDENFELLTTPVLQQNETYIAFLEEWRFQDDGAPDDYPATICFDVSFSPTP